MRARITRLSLTLALIALVLAGCQRDEPAAVTTVRPQPEATQPETRTAWVDAERLANADAEPGNGTE